MDIDPLHLVQTFSDAGEINKNSALSMYLDYNTKLLFFTHKKIRYSIRIWNIVCVFNFFELNFEFFFVGYTVHLTLRLLMFIVYVYSNVQQCPATLQWLDIVNILLCNTWKEVNHFSKETSFYNSCPIKWFMGFVPISEVQNLSEGTVVCQGSQKTVTVFLNWPIGCACSNICILIIAL